MKFTQIFSLLSVAFLLSTIAACASTSENSVPKGATGSTLQTTTTETSQSTQVAQTPPNAQQPPTKTETISVEGEETEISLNLYDEASEVFTTYVPKDDFVAESGSSGEGTGTRFYFNAGGTKNEAVYVHMFFPAQATSLEQIKKLVVQPGGLFASNRWQVVNPSEEVPYSWAKERIVFREGMTSENIMGDVYIG
ncbi:MAG: hypothetical protein F6K28_44285, partial [Microcoleus sp. SIO2G3]|nr:hypothetical protein [Microcoleus sp. SIO2G3]